MNDYEIGYKGCYIQDHNFSYVCTIPIETAIAWVKTSCPGHDMGCGMVTGQLTIDKNTDTDADKNGWLNKMFIVVSESNGKWIALAKWDDRFFVYKER